MNDKFEGFLYGAAAVLLGVVFKWAVDGFTRRQERRQHAAFLSVRTVYELDRFTRACFDIANDWGPSADQSPTDVAPGAPSFSPQDLPVDWKSIDIKVTYAVLNLPSDQAAAEDRVLNQYGRDPSSLRDAAFMRAGEYAALGVSAARLALTLREIGNLPAPDADLLGLMTVALDAHKAEEMRRTTSGGGTAAQSLHRPLPVG
ncbi:hypothetical protein [Roseateles sp.]|uniref:hypothetical protein n=1 Tax=Roseateles sp. TaxID=1971397 RepID=UPI0025EA426B|nr:hypothetical protein [Roseateles sp.]MBV8037806.1 hypothetical protein [Roseateles sp.]